MKMQNLFIFGALGLGIYLLFSKRVKPRTFTESIAKGYYPGIQEPLQVGAKSCPPGYYLDDSMFGTTCRPYPTKMPDGTAPVILKANEDMVYDNGVLVPVSSLFK